MTYDCLASTILLTSLYAWFCFKWLRVLRPIVLNVKYRVALLVSGLIYTIKSHVVRPLFSECSQDVAQEMERN